MPLCNLDDINVFLPEDKLSALDADDNSMQLDAERIVKAKLSGTYSPVVLAGWITPALTPQTIRAVAGRLVAALYYRKAFSEESLNVPEYAQNLYNEAMEILCKIVDGLIVLPEVPPVDQPDSGLRLTADSFVPNADTVGPFFTMTETWG